MPTLSVLCRGCFRYFPVDSQLAGQNVFCPKCNAVVSVPIPEVAPDKPLPLHLPSSDPPVLAQIVTKHGSSAWRALNKPLGCLGGALIVGFAGLLFMCCGGLVGTTAKPLPPNKRASDPVVRRERKQAFTGDLGKLQGVWKQINGYRVWKYVIAGNTLTEYTGYRQSHGGIRASSGELRIDESTDLKQISWHGHNQGIYKLEGNRLTICFVPGSPPEDRPTVFADDPDRAINVWIFERSR